ncbi:electron transfer flavoprotein subunit beta [Gluconacetobacter tumulisoli]|uniref:Electron transfer flavoprotein subunit beta n=1 Tax=Gluconacetobacter tumulisoli TaxID=1286189 RepID=A0A7W4PMA3_9PROT|nr:electron transfer flavoprotein subunit beta [Gluconacetobacter tumulisoli]
MRAVVLLSAGIDPVSGRPAPVGTEIRAIGLARALGARMIGLHAGPAAPVLREYAGYGLADIVCLDGAGHDPVAALARAIVSGSLFTDGTVDLVLAGRRASGGMDSGLLPYAVAERLGWPIVADVAEGQVAVPASRPPEFDVEQARPRGTRRAARVAAPCALAVHDVASCVPDFVFARTRMAVLRTMPSGLAEPSAPVTETVEERAYRRRPRLIASTATQAPGGQVLVDPPPQDAARAIIDHLRALGVLPPPAGS